MTKRRDGLGEFRDAVFARDGLKCRYCGKTSATRKGLHLDHVIPWSKGGMTTFANLVVACARCNMSKGAKLTQHNRDYVLRLERELSDLEAARSWAAIMDTGYLPDEFRERFEVCGGVD